MNSENHPDNILYVSVTDIGIAYIYNASSYYGSYDTMELAWP